MGLKRAGTYKLVFETTKRLISLGRKRESHTRTNRQHVQADEEGNLGIPVCQESPGTGSAQQNVGNTEDSDAPADELETTGLGVGQVAGNERKRVRQHAERLRDGVGCHSTQTQGTSRLLSTAGWCTPAVTAIGERAVDIVGDDVGDTVVGTTLAELDGADEIGDDRKGSGNTAQGPELFLGGLALVVCLHHGRVEERRMAVAHGRQTHLLVNGRAGTFLGVRCRGILAR